MSLNGQPLIFGEVLFDHFPDGQQTLGGAPFNVAWHLQAMGAKPLFLSRIGQDSQGDTIKTAMQSWGMDTSLLQSDAKHPTGLVDVSFTDNEPNYEIVTDVAYDFIAANKLPPLENINLLYHGTLALRNAHSYATLQSIKNDFSGLIFMDVNLRPPWWQQQILSDCLHDSHWVKLNHEELAQLGFNKQSLQSEAEKFLKEFQLQGLIVTCGAQGAHALSDDGQWQSITPTLTSAVIDTVGAGDAFTSVIINGLIHHWDLQQTLERAQDFASQIVGIRGATPNTAEFYQSILKYQHAEA